MLCCHIASVCRDNGTILGKDPKGFLLSSLCIFWWYQQYYLYSLSHKKDHQQSKQALIACATNDMPGLPCPGRLNSPTTFPCSKHVFKAYYKPATDCLLNYSSHDAIATMQKIRDRSNPICLPENVPVGLSQMSFLPEDNDNGSDKNEWSHPMEELSDTEDYHDSRKVLSRHYNDLSEAFNNSKEKDTLEEEFKEIMN
jgi:hypothetical protein